MLVAGGPRVSRQGAILCTHRGMLASRLSLQRCLCGCPIPCFARVRYLSFCLRWRRGLSATAAAEQLSLHQATGRIPDCHRLDWSAAGRFSYVGKAPRSQAERRAPVKSIRCVSATRPTGRRNSENRPQSPIIIACPYQRMSERRTKGTGSPPRSCLVGMSMSMSSDIWAPSSAP